MTQSFELYANWSLVVEARGTRSLIGGLFRADLRHADIVCIIGPERARGILRVRRGRRFAPTGGTGPFGAPYEPLRPAFDFKVLDALAEVLLREIGKPCMLDIAGPDGKEDPVLIFNAAERAR